MARDPRPESESFPEDLPEDPLWSYDPGRSVLRDAASSVLEMPTLIVYRPGEEGSAKPADLSAAEPRPVGKDLEILGPLAEGGMGEVWLGRQRGLERSVAVKCLRGDRLEEMGEEQRSFMEGLFRQEALTAASLEHPNIVPVYQLGKGTDGRLLLAMKRVRGRSWFDRILEDFDLPVDEFLTRHLQILVDVSQAVAYAHSEGVIHRDLKPHQVIIGQFGEVMLTDWGLALRFGSEARSATPEAGVLPEADALRDVASGSDGPAGTPGFMAPEQTQDDGDALGPWTDLYLLGGTLYFLLTGRPPHPGGSGTEAFAAAVRGRVTPPGERRTDRHIPEELEELTMAVLAPEPGERRPQDVPGFIEAIQRYQSGVTRRHRSAEITKQAAKALREIPAASERSYRDLDRLGSDLRRALSLWPENLRAEELRDRLRADYAATALHRGDLALARLQAEQLSEGAVRDEILRGVAEVEERQNTVLRQRRLALRGVAALIVLLLLGGFKYLLDQRRANALLTAQRDAAREARAEAEGLMTFMLDDIWTGLLDIERVDLLEPVARRASEYYAGKSTDGLTTQERLNRGKMFTTVGELLVYQGLQTEALESFQRADEIFRQVYETTEEPEALVLSMVTRNALGQALNDSGEKRRALALLEENQREAAEALESRSEDAELRAISINALDLWAIAAYDLGELEAAREGFSRAATLLEEARKADSEAFDPFYDRGVSMRLAVTLNESGNPEEALAELDRAYGDLFDPERSDLEDKADIFAVSVRAEVLAELGRWGEATEALRAASSTALRATNKDPGNNEKRYGATVLFNSLGENLAALGDAAGARSAWRQVLDLFEPVRESGDLLYVNDLAVRALLRLGRDEEALPLIRDLLAKDWEHRNFRALLREYGIEPDGAPEDTPTMPEEAPL